MSNSIVFGVLAPPYHELLGKTFDELEWPCHRSQQCGQIQKIGWESKPNRKNLYILQKQQLHSLDSIVVFNQLPCIKSICFKVIYAKKEILFSFILECSQVISIQNQGDFQQPHPQEYFHHKYHLLFKYQNLIFSASSPTIQIFSTSYPINENEIDHTGSQWH